ncbi:MAG: hypothetical protein AB1792_01145 [Candidatus Zixiibacteriota bacterium]
MDTLVSSSALGFWTYEFMAYDTIRESSRVPGSRYYSSEAISDQEYFTTFYDTSVSSHSGIDFIENRRHRPIGLAFHQTSHSWSTGFAKRFIIFEYWIENISGDTLHQCAVGLSLSPLVGYTGGTFGDGTCGLLREVPGIVSATVDTLDVAWAADIDGKPTRSGSYFERSPTAVLGVRILRAPMGGNFSFNWWGSTSGTDYAWGPRRQRDQLRFTPSQGMPLGDRHRYRMMTNGEIDYDQVYCALDHYAEGWSPNLPQDAMREIAQGTWISFVLSYGPLPDIPPGDSIPFTFALIAGANFHTNPRNFADNFDPMNPKRYLDNLDFTDLIQNACWADWIFDFPGVDTDGDGYRGKYHVTNCNPSGTVCDTVWYKGDGIPDWAGPQAPSSPPFEFSTAPHKITLRWNGAIPETSRDQLSRKRDWEGYRVYSSRFDVDDKYELIASWDKPDDFTRWAYQSKTNDWKQVSYPLTVDQWRAVMDDPEFDPLDHSHPSFESAYRDTIIDTVVDVHGTIIEIVPRLRYSYWIPENANRGNRYWGADRWEDNLIQKVGEQDTIIDSDTLSYGIYEMTLDNLNAAIPLYFAITAYDYGDYVRNVTTLEGSPHTNSQYCHLLYSSDVVIDSGLQVSVFPNPYKIQFKDAFGDWTSYYREGYEGPGKPVMDERDRRIWFINLPDTAEINIYTLDGDLVRKILHPDPFLTTYPSIVGWDLISRNTQAVVSGIYIWRVDSRLGRQIGKLVIIK